MNSYRKNDQARRLFDGIARDYEWPAEAFSLFQYGRWRNYLVSRLDISPQSSVLDVCTGTGLVAAQIARTTRSYVVGVDLSKLMLHEARRSLAVPGQSPLLGLVEGRAESLPFADRSFDAVVFTFLLRYVDDPSATLLELGRVLRPGGQMVSLEFFMPQNPALHALWLLHTRLMMPGVTRFAPRGWRDVGSFLGPSISAFYRDHTLQDVSDMWTAAGVLEVQTKPLSLGGAVVMWGRKEASDEN